MSDSAADRTGSGVATTLVFGVAVFSGVFLAFCYLREKFPAVYAPRLQSNLKSKLSVPVGFFGWIWPTLSLSDEHIFSYYGLDALMYLTNLKNSFFVVGGFIVFAFPVLISAFSRGNQRDLPDTDPNQTAGLAIYSQSNVQQQSSLLWAAVVGLYLLTALVMFVMFKTYQKYVNFRHRAAHLPRTKNFSIMLQQVPPAARYSLKEFFQQLLEATVESVHTPFHTPKLTKKREEYEATIAKLEHIDAVQNKKQITVQHRTGMLGLFGPKVDSKPFYLDKAAKLSAEIQTMQSGVFEAVEKKEVTKDMTSVAFVTFTDTKTPRLVGQVVLSETTGQMLSGPAPDPADVYWGNLHITGRAFEIRSLIVACAVIFLVFFWSIPVTFLQAIANLPALSKIDGFGWLDFINSQPEVVKGIFSSLLPSLVLTVFMALLIPIIRSLGIAQGLNTYSKLNRSIYTRYYLFLVFNVFLVSTIAGSILKVLNEMIDDPSVSNVVNLLATSLPQQGMFFMSYIIINAFSSQGTVLLNAGFLIVRWLKLKYLAITPRERKAASSPGEFSYPDMYAQGTIIWTLAVVYANITPILLVFALCYFGLCYMVHKYMIVFVHEQTIQNDGCLWPNVFRRNVVGLLIAQATLVGLFGIKEFPAGAALCVVIFALTCVYSNRVQEYFTRPAEYSYLALDGEPVATAELSQELKLKNAYLQPNLLPLDKEESDAVRDGSTLPPSKSGSDVPLARVV
eukprot:GILK01004744.1.p1 GENE.GILK01004744.1~~GILK01004744.1.p1  ORF type:complete len:735 (-),score=131.07 GILK01004744.1:171-2375(-)